MESWQVLTSKQGVGYIKALLLGIAIVLTVALPSTTPDLNKQSQPQPLVEIQQVTEATPLIPNETVEVAVTPATEIVTVQETPVIRPSNIELLRAVNIPEDQWYAVDYILTKESGWCHTRWQHKLGNCPDTYYDNYVGAENDRSLGYGLCQSTPAIKMETAGSDWRTNAITQLRWCNDYAIARYGSWHGAYNAWVRQRWW